MVTSFAFTCCDKIINGLVVVIIIIMNLIIILINQENIETWGAFHSTKKSGLNFGKRVHGTAFSKTSKKRATLWGIPKFSETYSQKYFSFNVASWISIVTVFIWMVCISEIQHFWEFWEISVPFCHCFQIFESFGWMESTHQPIG